MDKVFYNEIILVTGSGKRDGIGYGIAHHLAELGAQVVVTDVCKRNPPDPELEEKARIELNSIAEEFMSFGQKHLAIEADLTIPEEIKELFNQIERVLGTVTILVNNAGICFVKPLLKTTLDEWELTLKINTTSVFQLTKEAVNRMLGKEIRGNIINISSISGKEGWPDFGAYTASKFAIIGLTQSFAREVATCGIRINAICPGLIATSMNDHNLELLAKVRKSTPDEIDKSQLERIPLKRYGTPEDVAKLVAFLASEESSYMTGQAINVTGGLMVH